jgi:hypothetical protein
MRPLTVQHITTYGMEPVRFGDLVDVRPRAEALRIVARPGSPPAPAALRWVHDVYDNSVAIAASTKPRPRAAPGTVTLEHLETTL